MAQFDLKNQIAEKVALNFQTINSDTTTDGVIIDTLAFESVTFIMQTGTVSAGDVTMLIQDGDDPALSDAADVSDTFLLGLESDTTLTAANTVSRIGYVGKKQFVRLSAVTDNSANLQVGAICVLGDSISNPTA